MSIFEKYPLPWGCTTGESSLNFEDANEKQFFFAQFSSYEYTCFLRRTTDCLNALADTPNPVQWVADAKFTIEENASILKDAKQRIAELEKQLKGQRMEWQHECGVKAEEISHLEQENKVLKGQFWNSKNRIADAIHFFTGKSVSESDISDWSNGIDPTDPEEQ